jgi:BCD family chlorophyll transporter-like MFS transporter
MSSLTRNLIGRWARLGPRFLPFADAATPDLPLPRLLRLSLFQVSVGMALVLLVGTLNRVMIVELKVSAALVALMVSLPVLYAPLRTLIGFRSDTHRSALGWRPRALHLARHADAVRRAGGDALCAAGAVRRWRGLAMAGLGGTGWRGHQLPDGGRRACTPYRRPVSRWPPTWHRASPPPKRMVGLMYVMLLLGTIVSALVFGHMLADFSPGRLVQVIQASAVATLVLNSLALWKQESRRPQRAAAPAVEFSDAWAAYIAIDGTRRRLVAIALGTLAFGMQDVLIEPYGGQILGMSVGQTTWLTAALATGGLFGFSLASNLLGRGVMDPARLAAAGAAFGVPAFAAVITAAATGSTFVFATGVLLIGFGGGLFGHGTLTMTMNRAPTDQAGLALGAWGAVQATSAGVAVALGGILRDVVQALVVDAGLLGPDLARPAVAYAAVYALEILLLLATVAVMASLTTPPRRPSASADMASSHPA